MLRSQIDLKSYITRINEEHKKLIEEEDYNYDEMDRVILMVNSIYGSSFQF